jgi:HEAT repeat protein
MRLRPTRRWLAFAAILTIGLLLVSVELYVLSGSVRTLAVHAAERVGADEYLLGRLTDRDQEVRASAGNALLRRGPKAVPALTEALSRPEPLERRLAAGTLARIGPLARDALPALMRLAVEEEDENVLEMAGMALGQIARDQPDAVAQILAMLGSASDSTRLAAVRAAGYLGDPRAVPQLIESLKSTNPKLREEAAESLGNLGPYAAPAIPALIEMLDDPSPQLRGEAGEALAKITRGGPSSMDSAMYDKAQRSMEKARAAMKPPTK